MKILSVGTEEIRADKRADGRNDRHDKNKRRFHDYAKALKN
jgi:hypothetical protein